METSITQRPLPRFQSFKKVWALKIAQVTMHAHPDPKYDDAAFIASEEFKGGFLFPEDEGFGFAAIHVNADWFRKHMPSPGGYWVQYEDGYTSWSPAEAFESGYRPYRGMGFGEALEKLREGHSVARLGWNGKEIWLTAQFPDDHSKMTHPYIFIEYPAGHPAYPDGMRVPWLASQTDIFAFDWVTI